MRNGSHRFWFCIAAAVAVTVIAVPAASAGVVRYDTELSRISAERGWFLLHGDVMSEVRKCERGRRVTLFMVRPGADRKLGTDRSERDGDWGVGAFRPGTFHDGDRVYAKVAPRKALRYGFVCRGDRSETRIRHQFQSPKSLIVVQSPKSLIVAGTFGGR